MAINYTLAIELQKELDASTAPFPQKVALAQKVVDANINPFFDPHTRMARAKRAYHLPDELTTESFLTPLVMFDEIALKGLVRGVSVVKFGDRVVLTTAFLAPTVLGPETEMDLEPSLVDLEFEGVVTTLPIGKRLHRPIHTPVEDIEYFRYAA